MAITAVEMWVGIGVYMKSGIFSWELIERSPQISNRPFFQRLGDFFYQEQRFKALVLVQLLIGIGLLVCGVGLPLPSLIGSGIAEQPPGAVPGRTRTGWFFPIADIDPRGLTYLFHQLLGFPNISDGTLFPFSPIDPFLFPSWDCETSRSNLAQWHWADRNPGTVYHELGWDTAGLPNCLG